MLPSCGESFVAIARLQTVGGITAGTAQVLKKERSETTDAFDVRDDFIAARAELGRVL